MPFQMTVADERAWVMILIQLAKMQAAVAQSKKAAVGRGWQ